MKNNFITVIPTIALVALTTSSVSAGLIIASVVGGGPSAAAGVNYANFNNLALGSAAGTSGGVAVTFTPNAAVVNGAAANLYAAPYISNSNGVLFGDNTVSGADTTNYLSTGSTGSFANAKVELTFGAGQTYLGLLWGSVDAYNTLTFYNDDNTTTTITGSNVSASANGNQGAGGTFYVNINSTNSFYKVVATSSNYAFEFDNVAYSIPGPGSIALLGLMGLVSRRRRN